MGTAEIPTRFCLGNLKKRNLERPRARCEENIDTGHKEIRWEGRGLAGSG
jgi:hypothetical protein